MILANFFLCVLVKMWDSKSVSVETVMENQEFLFSKFAEGLCKTTDCIFSTMGNGPVGQFGIGDGENESIFQQVLGQIADAFIRSTQQGNVSQRASQTAGSAVQSGGPSIIDTMNRMNNLRVSQQAAMGA
jgi:hypothetical protein